MAANTGKTLIFTGLGVLMLLGLALGAWLLTVQPVGAQATETKKVDHPENSTRQVTGFTARDPEGGNVYWSLSGTDAADFSLSRTKGPVTALHFKSPPDYDSPTDRAGVSPSTATAEDRIYEVTVSAGDGGLSTIKEFMVEVTVTNENEPGSITLTPVQPQRGKAMTASVSDPDEANNVVYQWSKSSTKTGSYTRIQGAADSTYTPTRDDVEYFIMVTATYRDLADSTKNRVVSARSEHAVRDIPADNERPKFYDHDEDADTPGQQATRSVAENTPPDMPIGPPFTAYDPDQGDILTYSLWGADVDFTDAEGSPFDSATFTDGDSRHFSIDPRTGQIMTKAKLNFEGTGSATSTDNCGALNSCSVMVVATDPSNENTGGAETTTVADRTSVTVTISVTDVEEAPSVSGENSADFSEDTTDITTAIATYTPATGVTWSASGPDGKLFNMGHQTDGTAGELTFKVAPNFETPKDADKDNVYEVDVVAADAVLSTGMKRVTVKVTNAEEDGEVTFPGTVQPAVGESITAKLEDKDRGVKSITWQWSITGGSDIDGATSATYRVKAGDVTAGTDTLTAMATYTDATGSGQTASADTVAVLAADPDNGAPKFVTAASGDTALKSAALTVAENGTADADGTDIFVTDEAGQLMRYTVTGGPFEATSAGGTPGEVTITPEEELNHEAKSTYSIKVTATDPFGLSTPPLPVTITVTDVGEAPKTARESWPPTPPRTRTKTKASPGTLMILAALTMPCSKSAN